MKVLKSTLKLVRLLTPGPFGEGLSYKETAKRLRISEKAVYLRVKTFKKRYPDAFVNLQKMIRLSAQHRDKIRNPLQLGDLLENIEDIYGTDDIDPDIKEKW